MSIIKIISFFAIKKKLTDIIISIIVIKFNNILNLHLSIKIPNKKCDKAITNPPIKFIREILL